MSTTIEACKLAEVIRAESDNVRIDIVHDEEGAAIIVRPMVDGNGAIIHARPLGATVQWSEVANLFDSPKPTQVLGSWRIGRSAAAFIVADCIGL